MKIKIKPRSRKEAHEYEELIFNGYSGSDKMSLALWRGGTSCSVALTANDYYRLTMWLGENEVMQLGKWLGSTFPELFEVTT